MTDIYVTENDSLSAVLKDLSPDSEHPVTIHLAPGTYFEKLTIDKPYLRFVGEDAENTIIAYDDYAKFLMPDGIKRGTFRSYTVFIDTHDVTLENITIANLAVPRSRAGQAIALYADGDNLTFLNCRLTGYQDTLFTGPLPPAPREAGGFTGPKEFAPRINGRQLYLNCYICGDIDFIFGSATAYFKNCQIEVLCDENNSSPDNLPTVCGYVTAASTPEGQKYGYIFDSCSITGPNCPKGSVYLGRPWRNFAQTVYLNCSMDESIHPAGFHDWGKEAAHDTVFYAEYNSTGTGADTKSRASFCRILTDAEASLYDPADILTSAQAALLVSTRRPKQ